MNIENIVGRFNAVTHWKSSEGEAGSFASEEEVRFDGGRIEFVYPDAKDTLRSAVIGSQDNAIHLQGRFGPGRLFILEQSLILEYEAEVNGRLEKNTDVWVFADQGVSRHGVIRQPHRTIWFEARLSRLCQTG